MADDPNQSIGRDSETAWREHQLRQMEERMRGMSSRDYGSGGGQFIEPVRLWDVVNPELPGEMQILDLATSEIFVSSDPSISSAGRQQPIEPTDTLTDPAIDTEGPPPDFSGRLPDDFGQSMWPPGLGRPAADNNERLAVLEEARRRGMAGQAPQQSPRRPQGSAAPPEPAMQSRSSGVVPTADGVLPEYGDAGTTFYRDPTASQVDIVTSVGEAADAVDNWTEMVVELLRRLTMNFLRHDERLNDLLDKTDSEDEADEF